MPEDPTLLVVIAGLVVAYVLHRIYLAVRARARVAELNRRADVKRQEVAERLEAAKAAGLTWEGCCEWATANPRSTSKIAPADVIRMSATQLLNAMNTDKKLSSEYVMRCFVGRAIATHVRLNAVTEQDYIAAVADAAECDAERSRGRMRGRLHGLPISIKEHICMAGFDATCGAKARLQQPADKDAVLVSVLKTAGAIPFARTNVPQLLLVPESCNEIYGDTNNPYDQARSSGGSSGGESALIAGLGSPLGVGTDVGGSIRIPATVTGICGLKPSYERLSYAGVQLPRKGGRNGQKEIRSIIGPMARTVEDLELFMDVCCAAENGMYERDQTMPRGAWDHAAYAGVSPDATSGARSSRRRSSSSSAASGRKLRFGYFKSDGWFEPAPACARGRRGGEGARGGGARGGPVHAGRDGRVRRHLHQNHGVRRQDARLCRRPRRRADAPDVRLPVQRGQPAECAAAGGGVGARHALGDWRRDAHPRRQLQVDPRVLAGDHRA